MDNLTNAKQLDEACETVAYLPMRISAPVTVTPFMRELPANVSCCGDPTIISIPNSCRGSGNSRRCSFVITQNLCIEIPIEIGAMSNVGNLCIKCGTPTSEDICTNCDNITGFDDLIPNNFGNLRRYRIENHWVTPSVIV